MLLEVSIGEAVRLEIPRDQINDISSNKLDLVEDVVPIVEFICYDIGLLGFRDLEAFITLNIGQKRYFYDFWAIKDTDDIMVKIKELLPEVINNAPWDDVIDDLLDELADEDEE